jgi:murein L,D-transpeptidase YcbB/YkuD
MKRVVLALLACAAPFSTLLSAQGTTGDGLHLRLNLPSYRLEAYENGRFTRRFRVSIGDTAYPTPTGNFEITRVEWDPWWVPPPSEWAVADSITRPGPRNPMGRVKLYWRDRYFLHGTPLRTSIGTATSHGCVRLLNGDVVTLAQLVHQYGSPAIPADTIRQWAARPGRTRVVTLERPVPLEIVYDVAVVRHDTLVVFPDVYGRVAGALRDLVLGVLADAGIESTLVRRPALDQLLERTSKQPALVPLARLLIPQASTSCP